MYSIEKIWTIRGLKTGRVLDGWYGGDSLPSITADVLEMQSEEWNELVAIQLGYGVLKDEVSNVGERWFYESKDEAIRFNRDLLGENKEDLFEKRFNELKNIIDENKVSFYWETDDSHPVIEVFLNESEENINRKMLAVHNTLSVFDIIKANAEVSIEMFSENNGRIMIVFDRYIEKDKLVKMVDILNLFGENKNVW